MPLTFNSDYMLHPDGDPGPGCLTVDNATITAVGAVSEQRGAINLGNHILAPGFVDLQVNGGGDQLFNEHPDPEGLRIIADAHARLGTTTLLPTFMTGPAEAMRQAAAAAATLAAGQASGIAGIHFEGPVFSAEKLGIHNPDHRRDSFPDNVLIDGLPTIVTLAPEIAGERAIRRLTARGVRVAIGHSNARAAQSFDAINAGASLATHLFNAMSQFGSREPGVTGAFLARDDVYVDFICDGLHVDFASLKVVTRAKPRGKCLLITDAMPPLGGLSAHFALGNLHAVARDGACWLADGTLAGSASSMATAVRNCVEHLDVGIGDALRMASTWPARYMGFTDRGDIAPGQRADLLVLSQSFEVCAVMRAGRPVYDPDGMFGT